MILPARKIFRRRERPTNREVLLASPTTSIFSFVSPCLIQSFLNDFGSVRKRPNNTPSRAGRRSAVLWKQSLSKLLPRQFPLPVVLAHTTEHCHHFPSRVRQKRARVSFTRKVANSLTQTRAPAKPHCCGKGAERNVNQGGRRWWCCGEARPMKSRL